MCAVELKSRREVMSGPKHRKTPRRFLSGVCKSSLMAAYRLILEDSCILSVLKGKISFQLTHMFGLLCPRVSYELYIQVHTDIACFCMRVTISKKGLA